MYSNTDNYCVTQQVHENKQVSSPPPQLIVTSGYAVAENASFPLQKQPPMNLCSNSGIATQFSANDTMQSSTKEILHQKQLTYGGLHANNRLSSQVMSDVQVSVKTMGLNSLTVNQKQCTQNRPGKSSLNYKQKKSFNQSNFYNALPPQLSIPQYTQAKAVASPANNDLLHNRATSYTKLRQAVNQLISKSANLLLNSSSHKSMESPICSNQSHQGEQIVEPFQQPQQISNVNEISPALRRKSNTFLFPYNKTSTHITSSVAAASCSMTVHKQTCSKHLQEIINTSKKRKLSVQMHKSLKIKKENQDLAQISSPILSEESTATGVRSLQPEIKGNISTSLLEFHQSPVIIDDDLEIVKTKEAEIYSHMRSDCPIHHFVKIERAGAPIEEVNIQRCPKCFCYICDKHASQCEKWTNADCPHCNANTTSSCWKARRNIKPSLLLSQLIANEITPEIYTAGEMATKYTIRMREAYFTYTKGISCEYHLVPCDCACHPALKRTAKDLCCRLCSSVHDKKKSFNYQPVRDEILAIVKSIGQNNCNKPESAVVLFEALLAELATHRYADLNQVTGKPTNPNPSCHCDVFHVIDKYIEPELIKLFTVNEIRATLKEKFVQCLRSYFQSVGGRVCLKRFFKMRHWDDTLLQSVLAGQNCSGTPARCENVLVEVPLVIETRVNKLNKENRFESLSSYLKAVTIGLSENNLTAEGTLIRVARKQWLTAALLKQERLSEGSAMLSDIQFLKSLPEDGFVEIVSLLCGIIQPKHADLIMPCDRIQQPVNKTALLLICLIYMDKNEIFEATSVSFLWLANWLNEDKMCDNPNMIPYWTQEVKRVLNLSKIASTKNCCSDMLLQCTPIAPQAAILVGVNMMERFLSKSKWNLAYIPDIIKAHKNNSWALYYLFTHPSLLRCGSKHIIRWLTDSFKSSGTTMVKFDLGAFLTLVSENDYNDVVAFLKQWLDPQWDTNSTADNITYTLKIFSKFALRIISEKDKDNEEIAEWIYEVVLVKILNHQFYKKENYFPMCETIGKACCCVLVKKLTKYKTLFSPTLWKKKKVEIFSIYLDKFERRLLKPHEIVSIFSLCVRENCSDTLEKILLFYEENHICFDEERLSLRIVKEVINILGRAQSATDVAMNKETMMDLCCKFCSHEALSWMICCKCSTLMPDNWTHVWTALARNNMTANLNKLIDHTLIQFSDWTQEVTLTEPSEVQRFLLCLTTFIFNLVKTLISCNLELAQIEILLSEINCFSADAQLKSKCCDIVERVLESLRKESASQIISADLYGSSPIELHKPTTTSAAQEAAGTATCTEQNSGCHVLPPQENKESSSPLVIQNNPFIVVNSSSDYRGLKTYSVRCPNCNEINRNLKSYSCRLCYTSLYEVLATGKATEKKTEKKARKLKRKKKLRTFKHSRKDSETAMVNKIQVSRKHKLISKNTPIDVSKPNQNHVKNVLKMSKGRYITNSSCNRNFPKLMRNATNTVPCENLFREYKKPSEETSPSESSNSSIKLSSNLFTNIERDFQISESPHIAKNGKTCAPRIVSKKRKKQVLLCGAYENEPDNSETDSKEELCRKNDVTFQIQKKAFEKTKCDRKLHDALNFLPVVKLQKLVFRAPEQPSSPRTFINPLWKMQKPVSIPHDAQLVKTCTVHLSHFPSQLMKKIHKLQPALNLESLYA